MNTKYKQSLILRIKQSLPFADSKRQEVKKELRDKKELLECAKQLGVVGDATRLKICYLLCHYPEVSVGEMANILDTSISVVSHSFRSNKNCCFVLYQGYL